MEDGRRRARTRGRDVHQRGLHAHEDHGGERPSGVRGLSGFGVRRGCRPRAVDMSAVRRRKRDIVESWRASGENRLAAAPGLDLLRGEAAFSGPHTLEVRMTSADGPDETRSLTAEHIFINAGARPAVPTLAGLDDVPTSIRPE